MAEQTLPDPKEQTLPDPNDLYRKVLADVKKAGVTEPVAEQIADAISIDLLGEMRSPGDVDDPGKAPSEATVAELRAIAEGLREERERLEWTATQVAHLIRPRRSPSIDPDPTPPGEPPPSVSEDVAEDGAGPARTGTDGESEFPALISELRSSPTASSELATTTGEGEDPSVAAPNPPDPSAPASVIPERLPIRRLYRPWRRKAVPVLLCLMVLTTALVLLLDAAAL